MPASFTSPAASKVDPNKALRIARAADYPKEIWYLVASVIFVVSFWHFASFLWSPRPKSSPVEHTSSEVASDDSSSEGARAPKSSTSVSIRRLPLAIISAFRITAFRSTVKLGSGFTVNLAEVSVVTGYLLAVLLWEFVNTRNVTTYQDLDITYWANRAGTIAASQTTLIVALAGKNNIISLLTGISYEKLNIIHRGIARVVLLMVWIHAWGRWKSGFTGMLSLDHTWLRGGILAASSYTLLIIISARPIRNAVYEFFYYSHVVLVFILLFAAYFHMQQIVGFGHYVWPALLVWAIDRTLRLGRVLFFNLPFLHSRTSPSAIEILSSDALRITVRRRHITWRPGQSMFLILPEISRFPFESHPFTISSVTSSTNEENGGEKDLVFLVRARGGLTKRLRDVAKDRSGSPINVIIDGPYGSPPDLSSFSTVVLISGGSGVSYCLPLFTDIIRRARHGKAACRRVVFIWSVRVPAHMRWISASLVQTLLEAPSNLRIEIRVQVTGLGTSDVMPALEKMPQTPTDSSDEDLCLPASPGASNVDSHDSKEKFNSESELVKMPGVIVAKGRPDVRGILDEEISCANGPVSVDVCGPHALAEAVRSALKSDIAGPMGVLRGRASVTLHVERFGIA